MDIDPLLLFPPRSAVAAVEELRHAADQVLGLQRRAGDALAADALRDRDRLPLEVFPGLRAHGYLAGGRDRLPVLALREAGNLVVRPLGLFRRPLAETVDELVFEDRVAPGALDLPLEVPERERIEIVYRLALRTLKYERSILKRHRFPLFVSLDDLLLFQLGDLRPAVSAQLGQDVLVVGADGLEHPP